MEDGLKRLRGNQDVYNKILTKFSDRNMNFIEEFIELQEKSDQEELIRFVHSLKGVAGDIGAKDLQVATETLEAALKDNKIKDSAFKKVTSSVEKELKRVLDAIAEYQSISNSDLSTESKPKRIFDINEFRKLIAKLKENLEDYNSKSRESFEKLNDSLAGQGFDSILKELSRSVRAFDYDEALNYPVKLDQEISKSGQVDK